MHSPKLGPSGSVQPSGSAATAKRRLVATLAADRRANSAAPVPRPEAQLLAQLLADTPAASKRNT